MTLPKDQIDRGLRALDAAKDCHREMTPAQGLHDIQMRETPPNEWTLEDVELLCSTAADLSRPRPITKPLPLVKVGDSWYRADVIRSIHPQEGKAPDSVHFVNGLPCGVRVHYDPNSINFIPCTSFATARELAQHLAVKINRVLQESK